MVDLAPDTVIDVRALSYQYPGRDTPAVHDLTFGVTRGEVFGFLGPSGAGKTTTQKILIGLLEGYAGRISILEREAAAWGHDLYERIGISFELPTHFKKLTGAENLAAFAALYAGPTRTPADLLAEVDLAADADVPVSEYSKGMKNRLSVARALLHDPELLFLDEPTAGLDPGNQRRIRDLIHAQRDAGRTIVLTTHDMATADELCDRVAFIVDGTIRLINAPRELKLEHGRRVVRVEHGANGVMTTSEFPLDELGGDEDFQKLLRTRTVQTIHTLEASLDQIFIDVTGHELA